MTIALRSIERRTFVASPHSLNEGPCRVLNVIVATVGLAVTLPLMLLIALAVKLTSDGPVIFSQTRIGLDRRGNRRSSRSGRRSQDLGGRPFTIYKFRTMTARATVDRAGHEIWASPRDRRVTALGRVLRTLRLDELPQLVNVLRGDMNIVGPRPEQPAIFQRLRREIRGYERRQRVPPGITGRAQIHQGYDRSMDDVRRKVAFDLEYIGRRSAREDLAIMLRTIPVMLLGKGAL